MPRKVLKKKRISRKKRVPLVKRAKRVAKRTSTRKPRVRRQTRRVIKGKGVYGEDIELIDNVGGWRDDIPTRTPAAKYDLPPAFDSVNIKGFENAPLSQLAAGEVHLEPDSSHPGGIVIDQGPGYNVPFDRLISVQKHQGKFEGPIDRLISKVKDMGLYRRYRNSGFVKTANKYIPKGTFSSIGGFVGGPLGAAAGSKLASIAGFGAYSVRKNSMIGEGQTPAAMHSGDSAAVIRHREYICDIVSSPTPNAFQNQTFPLNVGMNSTFPWLSALAQQYQKYRVEGMVFEFKSNYADAIASSAANSSLGYVIMGTEYNSVLPSFVNKQQMDNTQYSTSAKPSISFYHPIECAPMTIPTDSLYVRSGAPPANADLRLYDLGNFQIASGGIASSSVVIGELWCTYEVCLMTPISFAAQGFGVLSDHFQLIYPGGTGMLGSSQGPVTGSTIGGSIISDGTNCTYKFSPQIQDGNYLISYQMQGTNTANIAFPTPTFVNCAAMEMWNGDASVLVSNNGSTAQLVGFLNIIVNVNAPQGGASISFPEGGTVLPTGTTGGDLYVTQLNSLIVT